MPIPFSDVPAFRRDPLRLILDRAASNAPGFVPLYLGRRPVWLVTEPELARRILKWPTDDLDKGRLVATLKPLVGESLLTNSGSKHQRSKDAVHRHVQRPAVAKHLDELVAIINQAVARMTVEGRCDTTLDLPPLALHLACAAMFGAEMISTADRLAIVKAVRIVEAELADEMFRIWPRLPWKAQARRQRLEHAREIVNSIVTRARASQHKSGLLSALEAAGLSDEEINAEILGLFIAGHHTTGSTIAWILYHLSIDPSVADTIALEADLVMSSLERNEIAALKQAPLSLAVVNEVLRLYPAGWWTSREFRRPTVVDGKKFKTGDMVMVSPWQLHRDARYWQSPDAFVLDRDFDHAAYMPFGVGPRVCIGMSLARLELQLVTLQLASAFRFRLTGKPEVRPHASVTLLAPQMTIETDTRLDTVFRRHIA